MPTPAVIETSLTDYDLINQPTLNKENIAQLGPEEEIEQAVRANVWQPRYLPYRLLRP